MYRLFVSTWYVSSSLVITLIPSPSYAQNSAECKAAINASQMELQKGKKLQIISKISGFRDNSQSYSDYPAGRSQEYLFAMKGAAVESVMNSSQLMQNISTKIIRNCDSIGSVTFGLANSGAFRTVGLFSDGQVKIFRCAEELGRSYDPRNTDTRTKLRWGVHYCSL